VTSPVVGGAGPVVVAQPPGGGRRSASWCISPAQGLSDGWRYLARRSLGRGRSSGSTRRVHRAVALLCYIS
jgi:hypothetical protein